MSENIAGSGQFAFGFGESPEPEPNELAVKIATEELTKAANSLGLVREDIFKSITDCLEACTNSSGECRDCIQGSIANHIDTATAAAISISNKVRQSAGDRTNFAASFVSGLAQELPMPWLDEPTLSAPPGCVPPFEVDPRTGLCGPPLPPGPPPPPGSDTIAPPVVLPDETVPFDQPIGGKCPPGYWWTGVTCLPIVYPPPPPPPPQGGPGLCKVNVGGQWIAGSTKTLPDGQEVCCTSGYDIYGKATQVNPFCCSGFEVIQPGQCNAVGLTPDGKVIPIEQPPTGPPTPPELLNDAYCKRPFDAPEDAYLWVRPDGKAQWLDLDGNEYGELCESPNCARPTGAGAGSKLVTFSDGSMQWQDPDGNMIGPLCPPPCKGGKVDDTGHVTCPTAPPVIVPAIDKIQPFCDPRSWKDYLPSEESPEYDCKFETEKFRDKLVEQMTASEPDVAWYNFIWSVPVVAFFQIAKLSVRLIAGISHAICNVLVTVYGGKNPQAYRILTVHGIMGWFDRLWPLPDSLKTLEEQKENLDFQTKVSSSPMITALRAKGIINEDEWKFGQRLNGVCIPWAEKEYQGSLLFPQWQHAFSLYRGQIITYDRYREILEHNGIPKDADLSEWDKIFDAIPTPQDLVRFMVRDVDDQAAIDAGDLDNGFVDKWVGKVKEWSERQALTRDEAIRYWRAHWELPSPTALYNMMIRLRPGRGAKTPEGKPIEVTPQQVCAALKQNDMAPGWVDAMMALTYQPMTRVDLRRAYEMGAVSEEELKVRLGDLGYDPETTERMADFYKRSSAAAKAKLTGGITPDKARSYYIDSLINEDTYRELLNGYGFDQLIVEQTIQTATVDRSVRDNKAMIQAARSAFLNWRLSKEDYQSTLQSIGIEFDRGQQIAELDDFKRRYRNKIPTLAKLCKLVYQGYLAIDEYLKRAKEMGYNDEDAMRLAMSCVKDNEDKRRLELEKAQAKAIAAEDKKRAKEDKRERNARAAAKERWPCKPATKPTCAGAGGPPFQHELDGSI